MTLTTRLDKIAAALGRDDAPPACLAFIGADGILRSGGVTIDPDAMPPGSLRVVLRRGQPAATPPTADEPPPPCTARP